MISKIQNNKYLWSNDPRIPFVVLLLSYIFVGIKFLGFNRSLTQVFITLSFCCIIDVIFHFLLNEKKLKIPFSALISGCSIVILANYTHSLLLPLIPCFFAILSKYLITVKGRHVFNPSLFGIVIALVISDGMISISPAYQWGGSIAVTFFVATAALFLFVFKIKRNVLIISFISLYMIQLAIRAWITRFHVPPETLFMGAISSPAFYLFSFYMITDPKTSPNSKWGQFGMAFTIVVVDLILHTKQAFATLFYAGFIYFSLVWIVKHLKFLSIISAKKSFLDYLPKFIKSSTISSILIIIFILSFSKTKPDVGGLIFEKIPESISLISSKPSNILDMVDPKMKHVSKWLLSVGDSVVVSDFNNDGLVDIFFTLPLKSADSRYKLYLNQGDFVFKSIHLPQLDTYRNYPQKYGLISGGLAFDYDNDGDIDLFLTVGFGKNIFLKNLLIESGELKFKNLSDQLKIDDYSISTSANVIDFNRDGKLDIIVGNSMSIFLLDYLKPTIFNIFKLPEPEFKGDRRMLNVMHRTWHNAKNGGKNILLINEQDKFRKLDSDKIGLAETRWTLDIATGDLNDDGWPDMYMANDFGPDRLYINNLGIGFKNIIGNIVGEIGKDTYKGMNASFGDIDNNGLPDIYVSNVHQKLQAEGSMLWINKALNGSLKPENIKDEAFQRGALNEKRFGWGAAMGDLDLDGDLDIVQANGMVDNSYDSNSDDCPDYWYWNAQIGLTKPEVHGYVDRWADLRGRCIFPNEANRVYLNTNGSFVDVADQVGITDKGTFRGVATADFDNDGDLDLVITSMFDNPKLYKNNLKNKNWIGFDLKGNGKTCSVDAHDSKIVIKYIRDGKQQTQNRRIYLSNGLSSQSDKRVVFGLKDVDAKKIEANIYWCGGGENTTGKYLLNSYNYLKQN